eukprot:3940308-Rhodomonas_salina.6
MVMARGEGCVERAMITCRWGRGPWSQMPGTDIAYGATRVRVPGQGLRYEPAISLRIRAWCPY